MSENLKELLQELHEYMDNKSDADHDGEKFLPNSEMKLAGRIEEVLNQLQEA